MDPVDTQIPTSQLLDACHFAQALFITVFIICGLVLIGTVRHEHRRALAIVFILLVVTEFVFLALAKDTLNNDSAFFGLKKSLFVSGASVVERTLYVDLIAACILVWLTGGSAASCLTPLYFVLPTMMILLLREHHHAIKNFSFATGGAFILTLLVPSPNFLPASDLNMSSNSGVITVNKALVGISTIMCFCMSFLLSDETRVKENKTMKAWTVVEAGHLPGGANYFTADRSFGDFRSCVRHGEKCYLYGTFRVTHIHADYTTLVAEDPKADKVNIEVEFPTFWNPPYENRVFTRDKQHPFEVLDVDKSTDGTTKITAREFVIPDDIVVPKPTPVARSSPQSPASSPYPRVITPAPNPISSPMQTSPAPTPVGSP